MTTFTFGIFRTHVCTFTHAHDLGPPSTFAEVQVPSKSDSELST